MDINTTRILLGAAGAGSLQGYYTTFTYPGGSPADVRMLCIDCDASGTVYAGGTGRFTTNTAINYDAFVTSIAADGSVNWQKTIGSANTDTAYWYQQRGDATQAVKYNSNDGYVYWGHFLMMADANGYSYGPLVLTKMQSNGTVSVTKTICSNVVTNGVGSINFDSNNNVYVSGFSIMDGSKYNWFLSKYDSSLNKTWAYNPYVGRYFLNAQSIAINGSNVHWTSTSTYGGAGNPTDVRFAKTNMSGTVQTTNYAWAWSGNWYGGNVSFDSNGFAYVIQSAFNGTGGLARIQVDPSFAYQNNIVASTSGTNFAYCKVNSKNELFVVGNPAVGSYGAVHVSKFATTNALSKVWEVAFYKTNKSLVPTSMAVDSDYLYIAGYEYIGSTGYGTNVNAGFVLKLPNDGTTGLGSYSGNIVYSNTDITISYSVGTPNAAGWTEDAWNTADAIVSTTQSQTYNTSNTTVSTTKIG